MLILFVLGGLQGFIGWWMVTSGLETRVSVSQYRLAIHLGAALLLLVAILWIALEYLRGGKSTGAVQARHGVCRRWSMCQMLLGALVAGLHAGLIYNTWPDMNGRVFPEAPFFSSPWWINFFENPGLAQFDHRIGAYLVAGFAAWIYVQGIKLSGYAKTSAKAVAIITAFQIFLGIATLLLQAPEWLAAAHQVTAALLLCAAVWHAYEVRMLRLRRPVDHRAEDSSSAERRQTRATFDGAHLAGMSISEFDTRFLRHVAAEPVQHLLAIEQISSSLNVAAELAFIRLDDP